MRYLPLALALLVSGAACTALIQLPDVPVPADGGTDGMVSDATAGDGSDGDGSDGDGSDNSDGDGSDGSDGDGSDGDGNGTDGTGSDGTAEAGGDADAGPGCTAGATQCNGLLLETCLPDGSLQSAGVMCPYACSAGACVGACVPGTAQCSGAQPQTCDGAGTWQGSGSPCASPSVCTNGACAGPCTAGATQCSNNALETCAGGQWGSPMQCAFVCNSDSCSGVCSPGATQCNGDGGSGNGVLSCDATGNWNNPLTCAGSLAACLGGACVACSPGATQCSGNGVEVCDGTGAWGTVTACTNQTCFGGACAGVCVAGATQCSGNGVELCDGTGAWGTATACTNQTCFGGACAGVCAAGTTQCSGNAVQACDGTGNWGGAVACGASQMCTNGVCTTALDGGADACGSVEICDNGIDDNCNGLVDCADPACTDGGQWSCTALPSTGGWTIAAYDLNARPTCPTNFSSVPTQVINGVSGSPDMCGCDCTNTKAATCHGTWGWGEFSTSACSGTINGGLGLTEGVCLTDNGDNLHQGSYWKGAASSVSTIAGSCSAVPKILSSPGVVDTQGETCSLPTAGAGCSVGAVCAPTVPGGFQLCATHAGAVTCPVGTIPSTVYTMYTDGRGCGACACATGDLACTMTGDKFYTSSTCTGSVCEISTGCAACVLPGSGNTNSMEGVFTNNGKATTCNVTTPSQPTGSVTPTTSTELTVCCQP